jgi:y4mF family transcriptional regulator
MMHSLAQLIRHHRKLSGLSQQQLAEIAGVGKTAIFDIEHGKATIQLATLQKILHALNIKLKAISPIANEEQELF